MLNRALPQTTRYDRVNYLITGVTGPMAPIHLVISYHCFDCLLALCHWPTATHDVNIALKPA